MIEALENKYLTAAASVVSAIKSAAEKTGTSFDFLMQKAETESSFKTDAQSKTSSASGLFQFIDSTWLDMVKKYGDKYGLEQYSSKIEDKNGKLCVSDCETKQAIMNLKNDPQISALMAGEYTAANQKYLEANTDTTVGSTELYLAHFMGAKGAADFLNDRSENGDQIASSVFTKEAQANKNVFYDSTTGKARTLNEVYNYFNKKFSTTDASTSVASTTDTTTKSAKDSEIELRQQGLKQNTIAYLTHTHNAISSSVADVPVYLYTPQPSHTTTQAQPLSEVESDYSENSNNGSFSFLLSANRMYAQSMALLAQENLNANSAIL